MKSLRNSASAGPPSGAKTLSALFLGALLLAAGSWATTLPAAPAREVKAADLIAAELPEKKSLKSASQIEFLSAVCAVVRGRRNSAAVITQTALRLRREAAGEIVGMVLRCVGKVNCEEAGAIVAAASTAEGDLTKITDAAMAKVPNCAEAIREAARRESTASERPEVPTAPEQGALIGTSGGPNEGFDPHEPLNLVCDDGTQRAVRTSQLDEFLRLKPGSFVGPCQATPPSNR